MLPLRIGGQSFSAIPQMPQQPINVPTVQTREEVLGCLEKYEDSAKWHQLLKAPIEVRKAYQQAEALLDHVRDQNFFTQAEIDQMLAEVYREFSFFERNQGEREKADKLVRKAMGLSEQRLPTQKRGLARDSSAEFHSSKKTAGNFLDRPQSVQLNPEFENLRIDTGFAQQSSVTQTIGRGIVQSQNTAQNLVTGVGELEKVSSKSNSNDIGELKTTYLNCFKPQQEIDLHSKKQPLAILGKTASMALRQPVASPVQDKSEQVDYLFEKALSTLGSLKVANKPSLFLVYAHDNPAYGQAEAYTSKYLIEKLSQVRVNLYSDQTPMGQTYSSSEEELKEDGKLEDILTNQLCLLPTRLRNDVKPVNKVVVCCSEVLGRYLEWSHYEDFYQELQKAYLKDCEQQGSSAIREVVKKFSQEKEYKAGFHHVLTEIAFLQIRAEHWQDQHGIIPVSLTPNSYEQCLAHFIPATTVRMEDMPRLDARTKAGEVYPNQSRHGVLFKLIERVLVSSDEAKTFLNKFWQGYSECLSRLKDQPSTTLSGLEFVKLVDSIFGEIEKALYSKLALTVQQQQLKHQQEIELRTKKEPLAILGKNIEEEYFAAWEEPGEIQDGLAMYVALQATTPTDKNSTFNLDEAVTAFLTQKNNSGQKNQVLLLRGEAGSGKSTFNRQLARRLWREYGAATASDETPIALYISLPTIDQPNKNLIGQYLSDKCGFSPEQIEALRQSQRFILILDGYDEIPAEHRNLYVDGKLDKWQAKIIVSCRPEYLTQGYQNNFRPQGYSRSLLEYEIASFSDQAIEIYIEQYVKHACPPWTVPDYQDALSRVPNVKELLGTPFLLKMALIVLPTLGEATLGLTRIKLYEQFLQTWFERSLARLDKIRLTEAQKIAFYRLKDEDFIEHSQKFNSDFALALSEAKTTVAEYSPIARRGMPQDKRYEEFLSNKDEEKNLLRFSALLTRQQQQYRFIHKSIQDYLVARAVWEELESGAGFDASVRGVALNWMRNVQRVWEELTESDQVDPEGLLNRFNLVEDAAIQRFLVERVEQDQGLVKPLLGWIKVSAQRESVSQGAANAMTILVGAGIQFNGMDLQGIRISGADLSFGVFDSAQLQGADLTGVKLRTSWLRQANLSGAQMAGVQFGEWPTLQEESEVMSCAYSPDGKTCVMGLANGVISVYDTSSGEKIHTLQGHDSYVLSVAYSPNGEQIASVSDDRTVRLWDARIGALRHTLQVHEGSVSSVAYSPNGEQIALGSSDKTVRLWDARIGGLRHTLQGHDHWVMSVAYSPNGEQIASGSMDKTVRLWDARIGVLRHTLQGHDSYVLSVAYSPNGEQIASGSHDRTVRLWDARIGALRHTLQGHEDSVMSVAYSPNDEQIASGSHDKTVRLWDARIGALRHTLQGHKDSVMSVAYSPNGEQIASGSNDKTVRLWDARIGALRHTLQVHDSLVLSVAYSPNGEQIASGSDDATVRLWGARIGGLRHTLQGHDHWVMSVAYSPNGEQIASGSMDKTVRLWDAQSGAPGHTLEGHTDAVFSVAYSPNGEQIASGSMDKTVWLWDARIGALRHTLQGHEGSVLSVAYSPNGEQIASGSGDHTVRLWDSVSGALRHTLQGHEDSVMSVAYSPNGEQIASGSFNKAVRLWEVASGQCRSVIQGFLGTVSSVAWKATPEGLYLLTGHGDKLVRQWEIEEGDEVRVRLIWMSPHAELNVNETLIEGVVGLSEMNRALMKQRGADDGFII